MAKRACTKLDINQVSCPHVSVFVSELETVCGKIRKEITKMVQREVNSFRPRGHEIEVYFYNTWSPVPSFQQGGGPYYSACSLYRCVAIILYSNSIMHTFY